MSNQTFTTECQHHQGQPEACQLCKPTQTNEAKALEVAIKVEARLFQTDGYDPCERDVEVITPIIQAALDEATDDLHTQLAEAQAELASIKSMPVTAAAKLVVSMEELKKQLFDERVMADGIYQELLGFHLNYGDEANALEYSCNLRNYQTIRQPKNNKG